jgi:hypothetical protein
MGVILLMDCVQRVARHQECASRTLCHHLVHIDVVSAARSPETVADIGADPQAMLD